MEFPRFKKLTMYDKVADTYTGISVDYFEIPGSGGTQFKVVETTNKAGPKKIYYQWYWKVLNFLTLGLFFNECVTYQVKPVANYMCNICKDIKVTNDGYPCYRCQPEEFKKLTS